MQLLSFLFPLTCFSGVRIKVFTTLKHVPILLLYKMVIYFAVGVLFFFYQRGHGASHYGKQLFIIRHNELLNFFFFFLA